jgi:protein-S-isoprenylcysteine O-methyltransferase Ste14
MKKLIFESIRTFVLGVVILGLLILLPAGTLAYWQAWVFILVFMTSVNVIGLYLAVKDPALLERRKKVGPGEEQSLVQKVIMSIAILSFLGLFIFCGLDHRFGWSPVGGGVSLAGDALVALGLLINLVVFRENSFGGSTVQTFTEQTVISSGPYALVRHPMYAGVLVMASGVPLALGSWWGMLFLAIVLPGLVLRILDEEKLLKKELPGYGEYLQKVRYRLVPYLW